MLTKVNILPLADDETFWELSCREDNIAQHFTPKQWEYIMGKNFSEDTFFHFIDNYPFYIQSYTFKKRNSGQSLAFIYIVIEPNAKNVVSVHGGGWGNPQDHYKAYIMMIEALLDRNLKVRTSCDLTNKVAIRFIRSVGFVPYCSKESKVYLWINKQRLQNSKIYKHLYTSQLKNNTTL